MGPSFGTKQFKEFTLIFGEEQALLQTLEALL
jgi:hypothetical protein